MKGVGLHGHKNKGQQAVMNDKNLQVFGDSQIRIGMMVWARNGRGRSEWKFGDRMEWVSRIGRLDGATWCDRDKYEASSCMQKYDSQSEWQDPESSW
jgi:hypothetical protein